MTTDDKLNQIAEEIRKVSIAMRRFRDGPLKRRAVVVLLKYATGLAVRDIELVLDGLDGLEQKYLKPEKKAAT